jgi:hypothetical protein
LKSPVDQGQLEEAAKMQREVLEQMKRILSYEHPITEMVDQNLTVSLKRIKASLPWR